MRKLNGSYWDRFKKKNDTREVRDGILFEDLVIELLKLTYPGEWKRTKKSHDDNRDFYLITNESRIWAECKNYEQSIALNTIAPTLVMAQIYSVNKIIFFSYSKINKNAHRKLYSFAASTQKEIEIYEEEQLDNLIIKCNQGLPNKFKVSSDEILLNAPMPKIDVQFSIIPNPILGTNIEDDDIISYENVKKLFYNNAFEVLVSFDFNRIIPDLSIEISANKEDNDNSNYVILDNTRIELSKFNIIDKLEGVTGYVKSILVKPLFFKTICYLPVFNIKVYSKSKIIFAENSPKIDINYIWNKQTALIGTEYRDAISNLNNKTLDYSRFGCFLIYGVSGTGKTRLLKESLDSLLMYKYRVINFIGKEKDSARILLKELIYFIFEIPRTEIFGYLDACIGDVDKESTINEQVHSTYDLIKKISKNISDNDLIELINNYFSIIFEKMSCERIALVIDNVQDFGEPLRIFLEEYITYSRHQSRANRSVLLLSINIDKADNSILNFVESIETLQQDNESFTVHNPSGFQYPSQALIFLKELLNEKTERFDKELEQVVTQYSTIPYYLWQFVYNLLDQDIAYYDDNNKCHIKDPTAFFNTTLNLYDPNKLLMMRWERLLNKHIFDEQEYLRIFSLISLFPSVKESNIRNFKLNRKCFDVILKYNYLKMEIDGHYIFDHDIVEKFLLDYYGNTYFAILEHIKYEQLETEISEYPFLHYFYKITQTNIEVDEIREISNYVFSNIPSKLYIENFLAPLIKKINANIEYFDTDEEWLKIVTGITNVLRNSIGLEETLNYYETINNIIRKRGITTFSRMVYFRNYINTYSDLLHYMKRSTHAINYLKSILSDLSHIENDDVTNALYSMIFNRLLINYREIETKQAFDDLMDCYNKSVTYAQRIKNENLRNEFMYLNQSDLGYIYYSVEENKIKLLEIWDECKKYTPDILPQKTLNFYRKMVQINLIEGKIDGVDKYILLIRKYINERTYNAEMLVFHMFCLQSESINLIQKDPIANYAKLKENFIELMRVSKLRGGKKTYEILNLKAIAAYYNGDYDTMEESFKKAYELVNTMETTMHLATKKELISNNIIFAYQSLGRDSSIKNIIKNYNEKTIIGKNEIKSILHTWDNQFNFMPVV